MLGGPSSYDVVRGGVACELVHLGSLYHDDVMDEADTRRGVETVNAKWGNLQAILAGDFLLARASEIAASLGTEVAGLLARTIGWLCEGQIEELRHTYDITRNEGSYFASIHGKTASLYGTAARIGGIVAGHDRVVIDALTEYGNAYGIVFQIVDDILDITATDGELGKPAGHDMIEGVYTLPVIRTLAVEAPASAELASTARHAARCRPARPGARHRACRRRASRRASPRPASYVARAEAACDDIPDSLATTALRCGARRAARVRRRPRLTATGQVTQSASPGSIQAASRARPELTRRVHATRRSTATVGGGAATAWSRRVVASLSPPTRKATNCAASPSERRNVSVHRSSCHTLRFTSPRSRCHVARNTRPSVSLKSARPTGSSYTELVGASGATFMTSFSTSPTACQAGRAFPMRTMLKSHRSRHREAVERPERRHGAELDVGMDVEFEEIAHRFDLDRVNRCVADPLTGCLRPRTERRRVEAVAVEDGRRHGRQPPQFDRMDARRGGREGLSEGSLLGIVAGPRGDTRAVAGNQYSGA